MPTLTPTGLREAERHLAGIDADWAGLVRTVGPCDLRPVRGREPYEALVRSVAYQQLHTRAGDTILGRMLDLYPQRRFPAPAALLATDAATLRACGYSARKVETMHGIAAATLEGIVPSRRQAARMDNERLVERLVALRGVGRWTVEMCLIFTLGRTDVLPVDDFGVRDGYRRLKQLDALPSAREITALGMPWAPWRSVASWYLWRLPRTAGTGGAAPG